MSSSGFGIKGIVLLDNNGRISFTMGIGGDQRIRALVQDKAWLAETRRRRLHTVTLDRISYVALAVRVEQGDLFMISDAPGQAVLEFIGSVDFAYDVIEHLLTDPFEAMTVVDKHKNIAYLSPVHEDFFDIGHGAANGRPAREVIENTRLDRVVDTGRREIGEIQRMKGQERVVSRIPIKRDDEVIGAIGRVMFKGPEQVETIMRRVAMLEGEVEFYRREAAVLRDRTYGLESLIGDSPAMRKLRSEIIKLAPLEIPVLIVGESGTGKELAAHALHRLSPRRDNAMVMVNAAALPATLVESELFGYEAGAFTGANKKGHKGKFEQAAGGTIFLDEIGDMPLDVQVKMLRVLQERMVERIGGYRPHDVDFRLIAATNCDLRRLVTESKFRLDLYYRISAVVIEMPPLRTRISDIPVLAQHFLHNICERHARPIPEFTEDAMSYLMEQRWPGNVRQLRHEVERAFVFADEGRITADVLAQRGDAWNPSVAGAVPAPAAPASREPMTMQEAVAQLERDVVTQAMARHKGNKKRVALELGVSRSHLYKMLEMHGAEG
jgi:transcriptional regulator with PAS, ATPase and Fis domain